jgi:hypothetical protein
MGFWEFFSGATPAGVISETGQKVVTGVFQGVRDLIGEFHLSPEAEQAARLKLAEMELSTYQAQISDVQSARQMQMSTRSVWPGVLTLVIIGGYFGLLILMMFHGIPSTKDPGGEVLLTLIGVLAAAVPMVLGYWFGTTQSGQGKDALIANSVPTNAVASMKPQPPTP